MALSTELQRSASTRGAAQRAAEPRAAGAEPHGETASREHVCEGASKSAGLASAPSNAACPAPPALLRPSPAPSSLGGAQRILKPELLPGNKRDLEAPALTADALRVAGSYLTQLGLFLRSRKHLPFHQEGPGAVLVPGARGSPGRQP